MKWGLRAVYAILLLGGVVSGGVSPHAPWAAPVFLVVAGTLAIYESRDRKPLAVAACMGLLFELIGVRTGLPFGHYVYTSALGPALLGVPLAMAFAWLILIGLVRAVTRSVALGALLMAAIDLLLDPLTSGPLRYWIWLDPGTYYGIPWKNFAGWILASALILGVARAPSRAEDGPPYVGWTVLAFFTAIAFEKSLWVPGIIGCVLLGSLALSALATVIRRRHLTLAI